MAHGVLSTSYCVVVLFVINYLLVFCQRVCCSIVLNSDCMDVGYLFQNVELLKQFISPYTGHVESYTKTGKYCTAIALLE